LNTAFAVWLPHYTHLYRLRLRLRFGLVPFDTLVYRFPGYGSRFTHTAHIYTHVYTVHTHYTHVPTQVLRLPWFAAVGLVTFWLHTLVPVPFTFGFTTRLVPQLVGFGLLYPPCARFTHARTRLHAHRLRGLPTTPHFAYTLHTPHGSVGYGSGLLRGCYCVYTGLVYPAVCTFALVYAHTGFTPRFAQHAHGLPHTRTARTHTPHGYTHTHTGLRYAGSHVLVGLHVCPVYVARSHGSTHYILVTYGLPTAHRTFTHTHTRVWFGFRYGSRFTLVYHTHAPHTLVYTRLHTLRTRGSHYTTVTRLRTGCLHWFTTLRFGFWLHTLVGLAYISRLVPHS